jgi:hypothetical protein
MAAAPVEPVDVLRVVHEEHILAVIPALRDMMGTPHGNGSG